MTFPPLSGYSAERGKWGPGPLRPLTGGTQGACGGRGGLLQKGRLSNSHFATSTQRPGAWKGVAESRPSREGERPRRCPGDTRRAPSCRRGHLVAPSHLRPDDPRAPQSQSDQHVARLPPGATWVNTVPATRGCRFLPTAPPPTLTVGRRQLRGQGSTHRHLCPGSGPSPLPECPSPPTQAAASGHRHRSGAVTLDKGCERRGPGGQAGKPLGHTRDMQTQGLGGPRGTTVPPTSSQQPVWGT